MRNYLVNIHRFYHYYYPRSFDHAIMPVIVFSLTVNLLVYIIDCIFLDKLIFSSLDSINKYLVTAPFYVLMAVVYFWYKSKVPNESELKNFSEGRWLGVVLCGIVLIGAFVVSTI